ncbi:hypothetical protein CANARDRAFT_140195 [[Candida] arabinofermentans NRRL YB-2248]|uniref:Uridylate kinase n=1 Tax=[Candida] arabinofermentans NRRL YB-2248 TaxID=983967 RepID=A0A1E4T1X4_9ASCO|nr:hypothetical protein CANARDRAFT_140195 [[Candida] arabinofermentans NRRL YB-2248]
MYRQLIKTKPTLRPTLPIFSQKSLNQSSKFRFYSTGGSNGNGNEGEGEPKRRSYFYPLLILGASAMGLTYYNLQNPTKPPRASIDSLTLSKPLFGPDDDIDIIFVLGGPGSGKGTQCSKLVKDFNFVHLSAGDLLRLEQANKDSEFGELIAKYIKEGQIVPQEITINLLKNAIVEAYNDKDNKKTKFLIDGFPRKMDQAISFENLICKSKLTLYFECPEEIMLKRLLQRGETSGRSDDNLESIKKRFKVFLDTSYPVIEYYDDLNKVVKVNCNQDVDEVYRKVIDAFEEKGITKK